MKTRKAFTLIELTIVVGILLALTTITLMVFNRKNTNTMREASRIVQATTLKSIQHASHLKENYGVRFILDPQNTNFVTGLAYVRPIPPNSFGNVRGKSPPCSVTVNRVNPSEGPTVIHVIGTEASEIINLNSKGYLGLSGRIQIPAKESNFPGGWYQYSNLISNPDGSCDIQLDSPLNWWKIDSPSLVAVPCNTEQASFTVEFANDVASFESPISLPSGVVIDLRNSKYKANGQYKEVIMSPQGMLVSDVGNIYLCVRDIQDATLYSDPRNTLCKNECLIIAITTNGSVYTSNADLSGSNLYSFAEKGLSAGR